MHLFSPTSRQRCSSSPSALIIYQCPLPFEPCRNMPAPGAYRQHFAPALPHPRALCCSPGRRIADPIFLSLRVSYICEIPSAAPSSNRPVGPYSSVCPSKTTCEKFAGLRAKSHNMCRTHCNGRTYHSPCSVRFHVSTL